MKGLVVVFSCYLVGILAASVPNDNRTTKIATEKIDPQPIPDVSPSTLPPPSSTNATTTTPSPTPSTNASTTTPSPTPPTTTTTTPPPTPPTTATTTTPSPTPPTTATTSSTSTAPATPGTTTNPTTVVPTAEPSKDRRFDGPSFIGGIVLSLGIMAIAFVAWKFYKGRTSENYHTL